MYILLKLMRTYISLFLNVKSHRYRKTPPPFSSPRQAMVQPVYVGVSKNRFFSSKMDGENNGSKPYFLMDDLGG